MRLPPYLARRAGSRNYSARVPLPKPLRDLRKAAGLPVSDTWETLGTSDLKAAFVLLTPVVLRIRAEHNAELEARRNGQAPPPRKPRKPTAAQVQAASWALVEHGLKTDADVRAHGKRTDLEREARQAELNAIAGEPSPGLGVPTATDLYGNVADALAESLNWKLSPDARDSVAQTIARDRAREIAALNARDAGDWTSPTANPEPPGIQPAAAARPRAPNGMALLDRLPLYLKDRSALSPKEQENVRATVKLFVEIAGQRRAVASISRHDAIAYKDALRLYPRGASRSIQFGAMTLPQIVEAVQAMEESKRPRLISRVTINHYLHRMSAFWKWVVRHDADATPGLFTDLTFEVDKREHSRDSFTNADVKKIFAATRFHAEADPDSFTYWGPILGYFTGARLGELCQMRIEDVHKRGSRLCLRVTDKGKGQRLKTQHSMRTVPVHPELIRVGFRQFVERQRKAGHDRLFPSEQPNRFGYFDPASKAFSRFMRSVGVGIDADGAFHRFRHSAHDHARRAGFTEAEYKVVFGHAKGDTSGNYGNEEQLTVTQRGKIVDSIPALPKLKPIKS